MSRYKAAAIHFLISVVVVTSIITLMLTLWYPHTYFKLMGGTTLIYLIAGVDVFIGPLLTLAVFKVGKKGMKFDLICIGLLQVTAMSYGLYVMFVARPIFTVYNQNAFYVVSVVDIPPIELLKARKPEWRTASLIGPKLVGIGSPDTYKNKETQVLVFALGNTAQIYPKVYDDYANHQTEVIKAGKVLNDLLAVSNANKPSIDNLLQKTRRPATDFLYLPVYSAVSKMVAIVDAKTGGFIEIIDAKPIADKPNTDKTKK